MAGISGTPVDLEMTAGLPYTRRVRVTGAALVWPDTDSFEVRSQFRAGKTPDTALIADLGQFLTSSVQAGDIVIDIALSGADTRALLPNLKGYYDIVISDPGIEDLRALPILSGRVKLGTLVTGASDE